MSIIYVPIDTDGFADRENMSITVPEGAWALFNVGMNGLYKPQWDGEKWIEGATPEEIKELSPPQLPSRPSIEERMQATEDMLLEFLIGGI